MAGQSRLRFLVLPMINVLDPERPIWRYLDFTRLIALLEDKALYFSSVANLGEPFEGSLPTLDYENQVDAVFDDAADSGVPIGYWVDEWNKLRPDPRLGTFVNCWHINLNESAAMWRIYTSQNRGVAIVSSTARLRHALPAEVTVDAVRYLDWFQDTAQPRFATPNPLETAFVKRSEYSYEQELRAVCLDKSLAGQPGTKIAVHLDNLICKAIVAPGTEAWVCFLLEKIFARYGCTFPVERSSLDLAPSYPILRG